MQTNLIPLREKQSFTAPYFGVLKVLHDKVNPYLVRVTDGTNKCVGTLLGKYILCYAGAVTSGDCDLVFGSGLKSTGFVVGYIEHLALAVIEAVKLPQMEVLNGGKFNSADPLFEFSERFGDDGYCITKYEHIPKRPGLFVTGTKMRFDYHDELMSPLFDADGFLIAFTSWQSDKAIFAIELSDVLDILL